MADNKKVATFGVSDFRYGVLDPETELTSSVRAVSGLNGATVELTNDQTTISADDSPYLIIPGGITEAKQTLKLYDFDSKMRSDFFGIEVKKGVEIYNKDLNPNYVSTMFKTKMSTGKYVWFALLKGQFKIPNVDKESTSGAPSPNADSSEGTFIARGGDNNILLVGREDNPEFDFDTFYKVVFPKTEDDLKALNSSNTTVAGQ